MERPSSSRPRFSFLISFYAKIKQTNNQKPQISFQVKNDIARTEWKALSNNKLQEEEGSNKVA